MFKHIKEEFAVIQERDPSIKSPMEVILYPSFKVMISYRRAHKLYLKGHYFWASWISQRAARRTGIEIHPGATIGKGFFIDHGTGVIIGETTIIGDNVTLYQGVTLGGTGKETGKRHPTLEDNVMVSAGAKVIGSFTVGQEFQDRCRERCDRGSAAQLYGGWCAGAHRSSQNNVKVPTSDMDQVHLPDPVQEDIKVLQQENSELVNRVLQLENEVRSLKK